MARAWTRLRGRGGSQACLPGAGRPRPDWLLATDPRGRWRGVQRPIPAPVLATDSLRALAWDRVVPSHRRSQSGPGGH